MNEYMKEQRSLLEKAGLTLEREEDGCLVFTSSQKESPLPNLLTVSVFEDSVSAQLEIGSRAFSAMRCKSLREAEESVFSQANGYAEKMANTARLFEMRLANARLRLFCESAGKRSVPKEESKTDEERLESHLRERSWLLKHGFTDDASHDDRGMLLTRDVGGGELSVYLPARHFFQGEEYMEAEYKEDSPLRKAVEADDGTDAAMLLPEVSKTCYAWTARDVLKKLLSILLKRERGFSGELLGFMKEISSDEEPVYFLKTKDPYGCFSQWYLAPLEYEGHVFPTAEHMMMWKKAWLFNDADTAQKILEAKTPKEAKDLGRQVRGFAEEVWETFRMGIVEDVNYQKFKQHPELKKTLLSTGDRVIAEAFPDDKIWAIGISEEEARRGVMWRGMNLLGRALMRVRERIGKEEA